MLVSAALPLLLIRVIAYRIGAIANWIGGKQNASNADKIQQQDKRILSVGDKLLANAAKFLAPSDDNAGKSHQQDECILLTRGKLLSRAAKVFWHKK